MSCPACQQWRHSHPAFLLRRAFTTSSANRATQSTGGSLVKRPTGGQSGLPSRGQRTSVKLRKKTPPPKIGNPPAPGARKAARKRVVLSNTNALQVPGVKMLRAEDLGSEEVQGRVMGIPGTTVDQLKAVGAFRAGASWSWFSRPSLLVRKEMGELMEMMEGAEKEAVRSVIVGPKGSGKTAYLLQGMMVAFMRGWIVINIPEAHELTNATANYAPMEDSNLYSHPAYTSQLLSRMLEANGKILDQLKVVKSHPTLLNRINAGQSLSDLCNIGVRDTVSSPIVFAALLDELLISSTSSHAGNPHFGPRPPILFALDGLSWTLKDTKYKSPAFKPIRPHEFQLLYYFHEALSGRLQMPNGGAVLAATSRSNSPKVKDVEYGLSTLEYRQQWGGALRPVGIAERANDPERDQELLRLVAVDGAGEDATPAAGSTSTDAGKESAEMPVADAQSADTHTTGVQSSSTSAEGATVQEQESDSSPSAKLTAESPRDQSANLLEPYDAVAQANEQAWERENIPFPPPVSMSKYLHSIRVPFDPFYRYDPYIFTLFGVALNGDLTPPQASFPPSSVDPTTGPAQGEQAREKPVVAPIKIQRLEGLSREESRTLLEYWVRSGMAGPIKVDDQTVGSVWAVGGGGIVGEMEKGVLGRPRALALNLMSGQGRDSAASA